MGLLMSALGGAAEVGIDQIQTQRKADIQAERDAAQEESSKRQAEFNSDLLQKRAVALEQLKEDKRKETQSRMEQEGQAAVEGAKGIRSQRDIETANKRAPSVDATAMGLIDSSLTAEEKEKYYGIKKATAVSALDDQIESAGTSGHLDTVDTLRKRRDDALKLQKEERVEARDEVKAGNEAKSLELRDKQIIAMMNKVGASSSNQPAFVATYEFLEKKGYPKGEIEAILTEKKGKSVEDIASDLLSKDPQAGRPRALTPQQAVEKAKEIKSIVSESTKKTDKSPGNEGKSTPVASLPKGAVQIGTSGGKPVYQTPDGKKFKAD